MTALILAGLTILGVAGTVTLTVYARWLRHMGETRIGLADIDGNRLDAHTVAETEAELMGAAFDLGRTRSRTLAEKLSIARNEIAA